MIFHSVKSIYHLIFARHRQVITKNIFSLLVNLSAKQSENAMKQKSQDRQMFWGKLIPRLENVENVPLIPKRGGGGWEDGHCCN